MNAISYFNCNLSGQFKLTQAQKKEFEIISKSFVVTCEERKNEILKDEFVFLELVETNLNNINVPEILKEIAQEIMGNWFNDLKAQNE